MAVTNIHVVHELAEIVAHCRTDLRNLMDEIPPDTPIDEVKETTLMLTGKCIEKIKICTVCLELQNVLNKLYKHVCNL